VGYGLFILGNT